MTSLLQVQNLDFTYPNQSKPALANINVDISPGEVFGFLGPSGAGKSTLQKLMIRLLTGFQGSIHLQNKLLADWDRSLYNYIGVSFEFPTHFSKLTAIENLRFFSSLHPSANQSSFSIDEVLGWVGLAKDGDTQVSQFSKGMKNRLSVARAVLHRPKIVFLDEPTAGLDPVSTQAIKNLVNQLKQQGITVVINTHNMVIAEQLCDQVAFIVNGKIDTVDAPQALKMKYGQDQVVVEFQSAGGLQQQQFVLSKIQHNADFLSLIQRQPITTIHSREATLEEVFIRLTGEHLGEPV